MGTSISIITTRTIASTLRTVTRMPGRHGRHNKDNVDFGIMDRIAMELPLSRVERPSWDVNVLCKSGFTDIRVSLPPITDEASRSRRIPPFMIVAERG